MQRLHDRLGGGLNGGAVLHQSQQALGLIIALQGLCLLVIDLQAVTHRFRLVIVPLDHGAAAVVTHALRLGGAGMDVEGRAALAAHLAAGHPLLDLLIGDLQGEDPVEPDARGVQGLSLGDGAGHPIQDEARRAVGLCDALCHDLDDHFVGNQLARIHEGLGLEPDRSALLNGRA